MRKKQMLLAGIVAGMTLFSVHAAVDQAKIDAVAKGELKEAKASYWGFDPQDSTKILQAAINSKVPRLIIDKQASPWISEPLRGVSDQTIVFEDGVELQAKRGSFKDKADTLLSLRNVENSRLIGLGKGGILRMHKKDYQNPKLYERSEWRYTLCIRDAKNIHVENMKFLSSGGDGIYIGTVDGVTVKKVVCDDNHRQGMSIICGKNILVEDSEFINTKGTSPASGVDLEPNWAGQPLQNIVFRNCRFANNDRWGILMAPSRFNSDKGGEMSIRFENCVAENNKEGEIYGFTRAIYQTGEPVVGKIEFINCTAKNDRKYGYLRPAVEMGLDVHHEMNIVFKNLTIQRGPNRAKALRIVFNNPREENVKPASTVEIDNLKLLDCAAGDGLGVIDCSFSGQTENITGSIVDRNGRKTEIDEKFLKRAGIKAQPEFSYDYSDRAVKVSGPADGKMEKYPEFPLPQEAKFWLYAQAGQDVEVAFKFIKIRRSEPAAVFLTSPSGERKRIGTLKPGEEQTFKFKADAAGIYKIDMAVTDLRVILSAANVAAGIIPRDIAQWVNNSTGTLYFYVPVGAPEFAVRVWGLVFSMREQAVKVTISNPSGKVVFRNNTVAEGIQYTAPESEAKKGGIWKITFDKPAKFRLGEYNFRIMGASPYLGLRPDRTPVLGEAGKAESGNKKHEVSPDDF
ncbi:MAG: right-handed parallel beta-helix repeat-containing protein [Lentisphaeria bacterium]|nr:right-handed parallel beta-helix repeat-containing protein [Lentisphaeria bacterium]